jgi:hypothetical protein
MMPTIINLLAGFCIGLVIISPAIILFEAPIRFTYLIIVIAALSALFAALRHAPPTRSGETNNVH